MKTILKTLASILSFSAITAAHSADCVAVPAGLISWWPGNGTFNDLAGTNQGTNQNGVSFVPGKVGQAFSFNGTSSAVLVGNPAELQLQDFTIECWIRRYSSTVATFTGPRPPLMGSGTLFSYGHLGYGFGMWDNGNLVLWQTDTENVGPVTGITDTNFFHHVAVTKSNDTVVFYADGAAYTVKSFNPGFLFSTPAAIGARGDDFDASFFGAIDEVSIYNRALSSAEIQSIYNAGNRGKCGPPPAGVSLALYSGITIDGVVGQTYGIQSSTNLSNSNGWSGVANVTLGAPRQVWFDVQPANQSQRYYRVVPGPISIP